MLLPLGSVEQHGPHLPLDTDCAVATAVARRAAALAGPAAGLLVAPAQPYAASGEHEGFPGTVSIGHEALELLLVELGRSLLRWASRLVVVNGHGGNLPSMPAAITRLRTEGRDAAWWPCLPPGAAPGDLHAGQAETSMMAALRPGAVRAGRAAAGPDVPPGQLLGRLRVRGVRGVSESGVLGDPAGASAARGADLLAAMAARLAADITAWQLGDSARLGASPDGRPQETPAAAGPAGRHPGTPGRAGPGGRSPGIPGGPAGPAR